MVSDMGMNSPQCQTSVAGHYPLESSVKKYLRTLINGTTAHPYITLEYKCGVTHKMYYFVSTFHKEVFISEVYFFLISEIILKYLYVIRQI